MACDVPSSDLVAFCLMISGYDPEISADRLIQQVEKYQHSHACNFGIDSDDFFMALSWLAVNTDLCLFSEIDHIEECFAHLTLRELIPLMLRYEGVYCSDEGEYWYDEESVTRPAVDPVALREFINTHPSYSSEDMRRFLAGVPAGK
jgi:hypothetical protein